MTARHVIQLNAPLVKELSQIIGSPEDHFTFELIQTQFFAEVKLTLGNPFVEVLWFSRPQEIQDACAKIITDIIKALTPDQDVTVIFVELSPARYYENGKHF